MDLISLIIIIAIFKSIFGKGKEENKEKAKELVKKAETYVKSRDTYSQQRNYGQSQSYGQQRTSGQSQSYGQASRQSGMDMYEQIQQQRLTKERLQQKYGTQTTSPSYAKAASKSDIVTRAKSNVKENEQDTFKQQAHAQVCTEYRGHSDSAPDLADHKGHSTECDMEGESDIIKRVNDLIVMGYSGEMKFERDFIAEGVEMINNFSL